MIKRKKKKPLKGTIILPKGSRVGIITQRTIVHIEIMYHDRETVEGIGRDIANQFRDHGTIRVAWPKDAS